MHNGTRSALIRVHTSVKEYHLVYNVKLVHNIEIRFITKNVGTTVLT